MKATTVQLPVRLNKRILLRGAGPPRAKGNPKLLIESSGRRKAGRTIRLEGTYSAMKLTNLVRYSHHSFASVFLALSLFGFLFPHHANQVKPNHQVNLRTSEQTTTQKPADEGPQYEWFY